MLFYAKIPFVGRIRLAGLNGDLASGSITADINLALATGTVALTTEWNSSGTRDLYINADVDIKYIGKVSTGKLFLLTLP